MKSRTFGLGRVGPSWLRHARGRAARLLSTATLMVTLVTSSAFAQQNPAPQAPAPATPPAAGPQVPAQAPTQPQVPAQPAPAAAPMPAQPAPAAEPAYDDTDPSALTEFRPALDPYGDWVQHPTYGLVWVPRQDVVGSDFAPYVTSG
ncbi:MAG TPA: hypothetical protein VKZ49_13165, partial [Polyangiaceae bacterium]|nr:hypothetical protein [Polyangiaceae bacterium]